VIARKFAIVFLWSMTCAPWGRRSLSRVVRSAMFMVVGSAIHTVIRGMSSIFVFSVLRWRLLVVGKALSTIRMLIRMCKLCPFSFLASTPTMFRASEHRLFIPPITWILGLAVFVSQVLMALGRMHWRILPGAFISVQLCLQAANLLS